MTWSALCIPWGRLVHATLHFLAHLTGVDLIALVSMTATVGAVVLAWWTIRESGRLAEKSARALIEERRLDFELDLLREIADYWQTNAFQDTLRLPLLQTRLRLLPDSTLPSVRGAAGLPSVHGEAEEAYAEGRQAKNSTDGDLLNRVRDRGSGEIIRAIEARLAARSQSDVQTVRTRR
jgi:hypothetical protein